jgi:bifunctional non-homologous end joining protein LigD
MVRLREPPAREGDFQTEAPMASKTDKLAKYQSMRDFEVTSEPARNEKVKPSKQLRFVIQKHAASRLHYDLRLEYDGVFLSWAVTKGPSLDPKERRLAVEVEPHPLDYGDFEGTIPEVQYGGGTVMLWDRGYWAPEPGTSIEQGLKKGDLKVVFMGERMKGGWVLVRMRWDREKSRGKHNNWLMIKHHDGYEKEGDGDALLEDNAFSVASGRTMEQIAAGKGKRPTPFMTTTKRPANAVWNSNRGDSPEESAEEAAVENDAPRADPAEKPRQLKHGRRAKMPPFVPPQLAKLVDRPPVGAQWAHEIKFDGYRLQLRVEGGKAALLTRKGLVWSAKFKEICQEGSSLPDGVYDGEAVALDDHGRPDFAALQAALSSGRTSGLVFYIFDLLFNDGEDLRGLKLEERKARLQAVMAETPSARLRYVDHFTTSGAAVLNSACHMHLEGIISKRLDAPYQSGRGDLWVKSKCRGGQEVVVAGYATTGSAFRSLIAGVYREGRLIHVGRVGTGFGRDKLESLLPKLKKLETDTSPFTGPGAPKKAANIHWLKPELVAEIEFAGWTGDGHIRQASFKGLREDKSAGDVVAEGRQAEEKVARDARAQGAERPADPPPAGRKGGPNVIRGVSISNPDKPLWPDDGQGRPVTKLELAQYLDAVADWMMPHIKGRPCSLIRTPDGIEGDQKFFQRHAGQGTSALITQVSVSGDRKPYIQLDTAEALIAAAQSGATEYHPWNCAPDKADMPGRLVFDLDPSTELGFDAVIEGALEIRQRLEALGLVSFCKTTGGKGLHVVTPLKPSRIDWPTAKAFARAVCEEMAADRPDRYLVNMAKAKRTGKIFLDYLRNDRMSTAVAPLSPRARPGAPVSFPLNWTQVKKGLDPSRFTLRTAPALLAKTRDWDAYCDSERSLEGAIKALAKARKRAA